MCFDGKNEGNRPLEDLGTDGYKNTLKKQDVTEHHGLHSSGLE